MICDMTKWLSVLIIGGYGTFGGRLAQLLADAPELQLIIAGRSLLKAERFCKQLTAEARLTPAAFDRNGDLQQQIKALLPNIIVDATGPFQHYGDDPYRLVRACIQL